MKQTKSFRKMCLDIYEAKGQSGVFDYVNKLSDVRMKNLHIDWEQCKACECSSPAQNHVCLVCGQETVANISPQKELLECTKLLVWTLENEKFKKKDVLDRIERLKQLASK